MYFPKYWTKAVVKGPDGKGVTTEVAAWGWSDTSVEDARQKAMARAQGLLSRLPITGARRAAYYDNRPFQEPILQDLTRGNVQAVVTRNSLGCEVLNTEGLGFADIDYVPVRRPFFASIFDLGGKKATKEKEGWETQTLATLRQWQQANFAWTFRVYRTAGGLRLLATSKLLKAESAESKSWLQAVGADPLYQNLCSNQKSFRARLTPKPWRCGLRKPPMRSPWDPASKEPAMQKWLEKYQGECARHAVCEFVETMGTAPAIPESQALVAEHDARTSVGSGRPLA